MLVLKENLFYAGVVPTCSILLQTHGTQPSVLSTSWCHLNNELLLKCIASVNVSSIQHYNFSHKKLLRHFLHEPVRSFDEAESSITENKFRQLRFCNFVGLTLAPHGYDKLRVSNKNGSEDLKIQVVSRDRRSTDLLCLAFTLDLSNRIYNEVIFCLWTKGTEGKDTLVSFEIVLILLN